MKVSLSQSFKKVSKNLSVWHEALKYSQMTSMINRRVLFLSGVFLCGFSLVGLRLVDVMIVDSSFDRSRLLQNFSINPSMPRADIIDRNGSVLATHLVTASVYANPHDVLDPQESAEKLHTVLTEIPEEELARKLSSDKSFVWLSRHITPRKQNAIQHLGVPGIYLKKDYKRVYPYGNLASHIIGFCDVDGLGISGIERYFDHYLWQSNKPLQLALDIKVQHILMEILTEAVTEFHAIGGNAIVMNIKTGEIVAMESLPSVNLNHPGKSAPECLFNRNTLGVHEPGSIFKILNVAIALETKKANLNSLFDATFPVKIGRFTVSDFKGKNRILTLGEAFVYSSNIAAIKIAQQFGCAIQQSFFKKCGVFDPVQIELSEIGRPIYPSKWTETTMMSSSYGYGFAISPLSLIRVINGIINDGNIVQPTLLYGHTPVYNRVISNETSRIIRYLMRDVVLTGTAKKANVPGYQVFGKTGTAYKAIHGQYTENKKRARMTFFIGGFPLKSPQYIVLVMLDDPKPTEKTFGYASAGWNVAPCGGRIIERIAPLLGIKMIQEDDKPYFVFPEVVTAQHTTSSSSQKLIQKIPQYQNMNDMISTMIH